MDYLSFAMDAARRLGADYADIRIQRTQTEMLYLRNLSLKHCNLDELYGYGIRVFKNGAWGFAHNTVFSEEAIEKRLKPPLTSLLNRRG